jgi:hypothetical protein
MTFWVVSPCDFPCGVGGERVERMGGCCIEREVGSSLESTQLGRVGQAVPRYT